MNKLKIYRDALKTLENGRQQLQAIALSEPGRIELQAELDTLNRTIERIQNLVSGLLPDRSPKA